LNIGNITIKKLSLLGKNPTHETKDSNMFRLRKQKITKASKNWHSKAMLIDPKKTKLTIIYQSN
jgi:hypothetical protein